LFYYDQVKLYHNKKENLKITKDLQLVL